ncbi:hypothetical protein PMAYCL1PPCAC_00815, partial [Pristionchus mayeri]
EHNRPGIFQVNLEEKIYNRENGMELRVRLSPANTAFYDLSKLGTIRFKRSMKGKHTIEVKLTVTLTGAEDPIIEQVADILSTSIQNVHIGDIGNISVFSSSDLSLCAKLLASSTIRNLHFYLENLNDTITPFIMSILSK